jgi:hypothetical protein
MPRDKRLFMTFPIDMHRHPKMLRLPPEVRWTFVEMNGEARLAGNDGVFAAEDAEFMWPREHLDALVASHPTRPLVLRQGDTYVIREFAEHQQTVAEIERLAEVSRQNGAKGGRPRKNPAGTQPKPKQVSSGTQREPTGTQAKAESESESESEDPTTYVSESSHVPAARDATDSELSAVGKRMAGQAGLMDVAEIVRVIRERTQRVVEPDRAVTVARWLIDKARDPNGPRAPQAYVLTCIRDSPFEVQKYIDDSGLAA